MFHTILSNPIFNKKRNRYILLILIMTVYASYYFFNMSELNQLNVAEEQLTNSMTNMLFSSLTNVIMIIAGFIYLIVTISFSLTKKMQYQLKILPFEKDSIFIGSIYFKLILSYCSFLIIFAIIIPLLKLFYFSMTLNIFIFIYCHLLYFASITFYHLLFHTISGKLQLLRFNINNILLVVFLFFYFFIFRFKIDQKMMSSNIEVNVRLVILLILLLIGCTILFGYCIFKFKSDNEDVYMSSDFYFFKSIKRMSYLMLISLGFIRNKLTLSLLGIVCVIASLAYLDTNDITITLTTIMFVYPIIAFASIRYYSTTMSYRKMNPLFNLTTLNETMITMILNVTINMPLITISIVLAGDYMNMPFYGLILFESALIMSIIFPKNKSSVNEFAASILCIILALSLYLISNNFIIFALIFFVLTIIKHYLLERGLHYEAA